VTPCDNFLYGFKGGLNARRSRSSDVATVGSHAVMPGNVRGTWADVWPCRGRDNWRQGKAGLGGGMATPAASRAAALRRGLPAARSAPPVRSARGTHRNDRELASARTANGHEHQDDDKKPGLIQRSSNLGTCAVQGEERSLNRHRESLMSPGTCQERLRRPWGSATPPLDRTRPSANERVPGG
jgi:hypothetical protein